MSNVPNSSTQTKNNLDSLQHVTIKEKKRKENKGREEISNLVWLINVPDINLKINDLKNSSLY